jgi:hypothetical protein
MRRPGTTTEIINARVAIMELRSLLVADASIGFGRRLDLIERASNLASSAGKRKWTVEQLERHIRNRYARNPDTFEPSEATIIALDILATLQRGCF